MRATIRRFESLDLEVGTPPPDATDVHVLVEMYVGPSDGPGEEQFSVEVMTASALQRLLATRRGAGQPVVWGRHRLFVDEFSWAEVEEFLRRQVESLEAESWHELASGIGRIAGWEFEDYREI